MSDLFDPVRERINEARAITWDTCHKIYLLMDDEQVEEFRGYGYDPIITSDEMTPIQMFAEVVEWYDESCSLRFVHAVTTNKNNPIAGFEILIDQFALEEASV